MSKLGDDLPLDIWREILLLLPAESLFRLRAVCKRWCKVIDDPNFTRTHTPSSHTLVIKETWSLPFGPLYTIDSEAVDFDDNGDVSGLFLVLSNNESPPPPLLLSLPVSTCKGLMLVVTDKKTMFLEIWNLSTQEQLQLPLLVDFYSDRHMFTGLGYDEVSQDFKVVAIQQGQQTHVYSLRSDTWTKLTGDCPSIDVGADWWRAPRYAGVFVCGALHWLSLSENDNKIVALDLGMEKHRLIQLPPSQGNINKYIDVLGECLVLIGYIDPASFQFEVWVMKDYGSDDESWTKLLYINEVDLACSIVTLLGFIKDKKNQVVFLEYDAFILFDVESNSIKKRVRIHGLVGNLDAQIIPRSIFRIRDHCGGGGVSGTSRIKHMNYRTRKMKMEVSITTK